MLTGRQFFPHLIEVSFHHGLVIVFTAAAIMSVIGALVSLLRGKQFYYEQQGPAGNRSGRRVPNSAGLPSPAPGMSSDKPARPGGIPRPRPAREAGPVNWHRAPL